MAARQTFPWMNVYKSLSGGYTSVNVGEVSTTTTTANDGVGKQYASLAAIAADTTVGSAHSGCPIIPCEGTDTLVFHLVSAAIDEGLSTSTVYNQRFQLWGIRPSYGDGVTEGPFYTERVASYLVQITVDMDDLISGVDGMGLSDRFGSLAPSGASGSWTAIGQTVIAYGQTALRSHDSRVAQLAKMSGLMPSSEVNGPTRFYSGSVGASPTMVYGVNPFHAVVGMRRYSHFMFATAFIPGVELIPIPCAFVLCSGLSTDTMEKLDNTP
jgi:hypothetical protein